MMDKYEDAPKKESMKKKKQRVGSITLNRKFWAPKINRANKRKDK
jgi:hypothetical protein